jgi:predicted metal-binding membrane protein
MATMPEPVLHASMVRMSAWGAKDLLSMAAMWSVMMAAMMLPSALPMVLMFAAVQRKRREADSPYVRTGVFLLGYLIVWSAFSLLATLAQWGLHSAALLSPAMMLASPVLAAVVLAAAGAFQWTPLKDACLTQCSSPLSFIMTQWREGAGGAVTMGLRHGLFCVGCCGLLMAVLFVTGVMNLLWVGLIAAFVLAEKSLPRRRWISRLSGAALVAWGIWVAGVSWAS